MFFAAAALAVTLHFRMVQNVPVATVPTDHGSMEMVIDSGSNTTFFTGRVLMFYQRVCIANQVCVDVKDITDSVPAFRKLVKGQKVIVDGLLGEDVLSQFGKVSIDYMAKTISLGN